MRATFIDLAQKGEKVELSFNLAQLDKTILDMKTKLRKYQQQLDLFKGFEIISDLDVPPDRTGFNYPRNLVLGFLISLFLGILVALISNWKSLVSPSTK